MSPSYFLLWSRACEGSQKRLIFLQSKTRLWCCLWDQEKVLTSGFCDPHPVRGFINPLEKITVEPELNEELSWLVKPLCSILILALPTWLAESCQQLLTQKKREMLGQWMYNYYDRFMTGLGGMKLAGEGEKHFLETLTFYVEGLWSLWLEKCALPSLALEKCFQLTSRWWFFASLLSFLFPLLIP